VSILDLICLALSIGQVCDTWFNGSVFASTRAYLEVKEEQGSKLAELFNCPFCLSHHVAWMLCLFLLISCFLPGPWNDIVKLPIYGLAALRVSIILNAVLPENLRY
jgi:hypothetical protein